jgi:hypothetical protein
MRRRTIAATDSEDSSAFNWCRISIAVSLVKPKNGRVIAIDKTARTWRATVYAPKAAVIAISTALVGSVPWVQKLVFWLGAMPWSGGK